MVEEPGGSSTETAFCLLCIGLNLYMVLTVVAIWGRAMQPHQSELEDDQRAAYS